jgi:hypothetical protein
MRTILLVLTFLIISTVTLAQTSSGSKTITVVGVCEILINRSFYNGKDVAIVARWSDTDKGFWLTDACGTQIRTGDYTWKNLIVLTYDPSSSSAFENGFKPDKAVIEKKIKELQAGLKKSDEKVLWAIVYGRVETTEKLQTAESLDGTVGPAGYGHLNGAPAQVFYKQNDLTFWQDR